MMSSNEKANILIVSNDEGNHAALKELPAHIHTVDSSEKVLELLAKQPFAVILLDRKLPEINTLAETIRRTSGCETTPIVFLTASSKQEVQVFKGYETGVVDYLFKPLDPDFSKKKLSVFLGPGESQYNQLSFNEYLKLMLKQSIRHKRKFAVVYLNLDDFEGVKKNYDQAIYDDLLNEAATRIRNSIRDSDTLHSSEKKELVSYKSGGAFAVILCEIHGPSGAGVIANRMLLVLGEPFKTAKGNIHINSSLGVACYPDAGDTVEKLKTAAEIAVHKAKEKGSNNFQYFTEALNVNHHRYALIKVLGWWICQKIMSDMEESINPQFPDIKMHINLSSKQFDTLEFIGSIGNLFEDKKIKPNQVIFELTETALMKESHSIEKNVNSLHKMGYRISIDDFGTGYSSLARLKNLPLTSIKIAKAFVEKAGDDPDVGGTLKSMVSLAHNLGVKAIGEEIENE